VPAAPARVFLTSWRDTDAVALSEIDRYLLERCLARKPRAWEEFVNRFMGLIIHVVQHTAQARSLRFSPEDRDDVIAEVFVQIVKDDFALLRHFRGQSSLATYLVVVARRIVVREVLQRQAKGVLGRDASKRHVRPPTPTPDPTRPLSDREEIDRLLGGLKDDEARVVRMFHLEGRTYREISDETGIPENSLGPILSRARAKMHRDAQDESADDATRVRTAD
jgi:RNA polymerase sigma-70 factor (ECF subfamily)